MHIRQLRIVILAGLLLFGLGNPQSLPVTEKDIPAQGQAQVKERWDTGREIYQDDLWKLATALSELTGQDRELTHEIVLLADQFSLEYEVSVLRALAIILTESYADPLAISHKGAVGLMQVMPATGKYIAGELEVQWRGKNSLFEVPTNLQYGMWYYGHLLETFQGKEEAAVAAYYWGPQAIKRRMTKDKQLPRKYLNQVLKAQTTLERRFLREDKNHPWRCISSSRHCSSMRPHASRS